ncbi:MAG TPA: hypothetical protein VFE27_24790 [Acidobacteriaceae bacterium]|nr:hypothetical protein [Acidobacteriaceae bacterium]
MSEVTESAETSEVSGPGPHLAQVDPPHPFRSAIKTVVIAAIVLSIALGLYVYLGQRPPVAAGEILTMNLYPVHTLVNNGGGGDSGMPGNPEYYDQLLILAKIKIRNQTDIPLFMQDISATIKLPDGSEQVNVTASDKDIDRVFQAYPSLSYLRADSIRRDITLTPGQSVQGLTIFNFPITKEQWDMLQSAKVVVSFMHQKNLEISLPRK